MKNILVISGHTNLRDSVVNKEILKKYKELFPKAEIVFLDKLYPDFKIDVKAEQERLIKADIIILQYPLFWYHMPSIMQRWIEETFVYGFAYGSTGDKLKGKKMITSFTMGSQAEAYHKDSRVGYEIEDFLVALKATCTLVQMEFVGYIYSAGYSDQKKEDEKELNEMREKAHAHANKVIELTKKL